MILYNVYRVNNPEVIEVWHPDLKKILKRYADVTYVVNKKVKARKPKRRKVYDYYCEVAGSAYCDGTFDERSQCWINWR
jgi:hypothetical protein